MKERIVIPLSKTKLVLGLIGSLVFIGLGIWFTSGRPPISPILPNATAVKIVGFLSLFFFGLCAVVISQKLADSRPGLIIDENGITDNSSAISPGLIPWKDITGISAKTVWNQKFILITVQNPQHYTDAQPSKWKKKMLSYNFRTYGTPLSITANTLKISFTELKQLLENRMKLYR